jgi:hypothetical protein
MDKTMGAQESPASIVMNLAVDLQEKCAYAAKEANVILGQFSMADESEKDLKSGLVERTLPSFFETLRVELKQAHNYTDDILRQLHSVNK